MLFGSLFARLGGKGLFTLPLKLVCLYSLCEGHLGNSAKQIKSKDIPLQKTKKA